MEDIRWVQRFENFRRSFSLLKKACNEYTFDQTDLGGMALIHSFETTYELAWKTIKDFLNYNSHKKVNLQREVIKEAFYLEVITDGEAWIQMLEDRNLTTHSYYEEVACRAIVSISENYTPLFEQLECYLKEKT